MLSLSEVRRDRVPLGKHTPTSVRRRSSRVDFRLRNPSSPDVFFVMKALFSILDPQNRVETNTFFVFAHDFVLGVKYCFFFLLLTFITDSTKFLRCLLFTDGRLQLRMDMRIVNGTSSKISHCWKQFSKRLRLYHTKEVNRSKTYSSERSFN